MSKKTVEKYKAVKQKNKTPEITPAEHRANCPIVAEMMMEVIDRLPKDAPPVKETIQELLAQMDSITGRNETIVNSDGRRNRVDESGKITVIQKPKNLPAEPTKTLTGGSKMSASDTGNFTPEEMKTLAALEESLKDG